MSKNSHLVRNLTLGFLFLLVISVSAVLFAAQNYLQQTQYRLDDVSREHDRVMSEWWDEANQDKWFAQKYSTQIQLKVQDVQSEIDLAKLLLGRAEAARNPTSVIKAVRAANIALNQASMHLGDADHLRVLTVSSRFFARDELEKAQKRLDEFEAHREALLSSGVLNTQEFNTDMIDFRLSLAEMYLPGDDDRSGIGNPRWARELISTEVDTLSRYEQGLELVETQAQSETDALTQARLNAEPTLRKAEAEIDIASETVSREASLRELKNDDVRLVTANSLLEESRVRAEASRKALAQQPPDFVAALEEAKAAKWAALSAVFAIEGP